MQIKTLIYFFRKEKATGFFKSGESKSIGRKDFDRGTVMSPWVERIEGLKEKMADRIDRG